MNRAPVDLLQALVQIPSPNPPGDTRAVAAFVADTLVAAGGAAATLAPDAKPDAVNVVATIGAGAPVIMFHAHLDTVPVADDETRRWSVDPYAAAIQKGRVYGKGSVDDKAPLAAMMYAFIAAAARRDRIRGTLALVAAAEEEVGGRLGTRWLADNRYLPAADFIIVGEQTDNRVAAAHKGVIRATVRATGRSAHATNPDRGVNAITAMARAILALEQYHHDLVRRVHPLVGTPTCNVGVIQGGNTANAVPDSCVVYLDRRMVPGEDPAVVERELEAVIESVDAAPARLTAGDFLVSNWFQSTVDTPLARAFLACVRDTLGIDPGPVGYLPGSDAKHLTGVARGEIVIFGPGSYEVAHAADEYVEIAALEATARILEAFLGRTIMQ